MNKFEYLENMKGMLQPHGFTFSSVKEINYGIQFQISNQSRNGLIRIYESKKGIRCDLSQIKDKLLLNEIDSLINVVPMEKQESKNSRLENKVPKIDLPDELIGTDESGKGDYFGPLVIAGVMVNKKTSTMLKELGVMDSKKLNDKLIFELAPSIKQLCPHSVVVIGNERYNDLYNKIQNLNKLLAWGHARAIENILSKYECNTVLSDQFGDEKLIQKALLDKGKEIILHQMHRAEENIGVAAASIIARYEYVNRLKQLSSKYQVEFPKGASTATKETAKRFLSKYGPNELKQVSKLHFKTTQQIISER